MCGRYAMRRGIEISFRELKYTVGLRHFHAKNEHTVSDVLNASTKSPHRTYFALSERKI